MDALQPSVRLSLFRHADAAWNEALRPWLEGSRGELIRSYVVVATRAQAVGLKQRCLLEGVPLLGVEFLTPGLARKKWLPLHTKENPDAARPAIGRELLLLGLQSLIDQRLAGLPPEHPHWGFWKSLQSDPERALDDFDDLLKAGFRAPDFGLGLLQSIFSDLTAWVDQLGFQLAPLQSERGALTKVPETGGRVGGRLFIYGLSAELWSEFSNVAALARRFDQTHALLPDPDFRGRAALDEKWVEVWQTLLGTSGMPLDEPLDAPSCDAVASLLSPGERETEDATSPATRARVLVGRTRTDEMRLVADHIQHCLRSGAEMIGVIFPTADAAHATLCRLLTERGIRFQNTIERTGAGSLDTALPRQLVQFYQQGARLEDLLELWPLLRASGCTALPLGQARALCDRLFDEKQTHALAAYRERLQQAAKPDWQAFAAVVDKLLPPFAPSSTLGEALARFHTVCEGFGIALPPGIGALEAVAQRETRPLPTGVVLDALLSFLPEGTPARVEGAAGFARVSLLTRRRAEGLGFSHLILTEANAGVWLRRTEPSPWLPDEHKTALNERSRFSLGLYTSEDRALLERQSYARLARDTRQEVIFSAALFDEADPETRLAPNRWVERVLWADPELREGGRGLEQIFEELAESTAASTEALPAAAELTEWRRRWRSRRDPTRPFDEYFLSVDPSKVRPATVAARVLESGVRDPAELWFAAILEAKAVDWQPFTRARKKAIGQWVHRVLAWALLPETLRGKIGERLTLETARERLERELKQLRSLWPENRYWESFQLELARSCRQLLEAVYALPLEPYVATELALPAGASVPIGNDERLHVRGRVDFVSLSRVEWGGANVEIVDFKTGGDAALSAERMAQEGFALQLGVYLAAAESLGAVAGRVWMLKPELNGFSSLSMEELPGALAALKQIGAHLRTGIYGALTPDASAYSPEGFRWPLACVPIEASILRAKHLRTFANLQSGEGSA